MNNNLPAFLKKRPQEMLGGRLQWLSEKTYRLKCRDQNSYFALTIITC